MTTPTKSLKMYSLRRMNALTPAQASILVKLAHDEPISPKSLAVVNSF